jgi:hypothetical protein
MIAGAVQSIFFKITFDADMSSRTWLSPNSSGDRGMGDRGMGHTFVLWATSGDKGCAAVSQLLSSASLSAGLKGVRAAFPTYCDIRGKEEAVSRREGSRLSLRGKSAAVRECARG